MLYSALILGLLSSLHCIGMCGPIAIMLPVGRDNPAQKVFHIILYHLGRITAYSSLGLVFGVIGKGLYLAGMQQQLSIIAGIIMIVIAMVPEKQFANYNFSKPVYIVISKVKSSLGKQFTKTSNTAFYMTGLFNGFLPCGMVYAALFGSIAMQNPMGGIAYMALYGIGTIPMMSAVIYVSGFMSGQWRNKLVKAVPYVAVFIGMLFIVRGLGLGIPFISPADTSLFVQSNPDCGIINH